MAESLDGKTILELGPGDGVATALLAAAHGGRAVLVDTGAYAGTDITSYVELAVHLRTQGLDAPDLSRCAGVADVLSVCGASYLTAGLDSLRTMKDESVELIFSQAVLEHVRKNQFHDMLVECRRILKPSGVFSNHVDLKDHLGGALNNLRFEDSRWESPLFADSGFYTNRIRYSDMLERFRAAGFEIVWSEPKRWKELPTPRRRLAKQFRDLPDEELRTTGFDVLLRRSGD
jgi:SAM-dependent methyltransferase